MSRFLFSWSNTAKKVMDKKNVSFHEKKRFKWYLEEQGKSWQINNITIIWASMWIHAAWTMLNEQRSTNRSTIFLHGLCAWTSIVYRNSPSLQEWQSMPRAKLYADGQISGQSVYILSRAAPKRGRRCRLAVGVETATPTAALGVHQAVGVAPGMCPPSPRPWRRVHGVSLDAEGYPRHSAPLLCRWPPSA
jgi:hypothetical protein